MPTTSHAACNAMPSLQMVRTKSYLLMLYCTGAYSEVAIIVIPMLRHEHQMDFSAQEL